MTYVRKYTKEQLIALGRERGLYPPEDATDEELKLVERRLSAERGWIADPPPPTEWHMPGWVKTGGRHFVTHREPSRGTPRPPLRLAPPLRGWTPATDP
jgi:hypothetical protein